MQDRVKELRRTRTYKIGETDYLDIVEKIRDPDGNFIIEYDSCGGGRSHISEETGYWMRYYDLVEEGSRLVLDDMGAMGKCGSECKTISRACKVRKNAL